MVVKRDAYRHTNAARALQLMSGCATRAEVSAVYCSTCTSAKLEQLSALMPLPASHHHSTRTPVLLLRQRSATEVSACLVAWRRAE